MTPTPEQIQAAMPAMREWLNANTTAISRYALNARSPWVLERIASRYPDGIAQFIRDQEESHGA